MASAYKSIQREGFSLVETIAALTIVVVALLLSMSGFIFMQKNQNQQLAKNEIDLETHMAVARLQHELRLSSLTEMAYYPPTATKYTAISFPIARVDSSGNYPLNAAGKIDWSSTVVYHAFGEGKELRLLRTEFTNRDNTLLMTDRRTQLNQVVADGNGSKATNGGNATTTVLFKSVFNWEIIPQGSSYDGYHFEPKRDEKANLGSFILTPGKHVLKLTTTGKDSRSSGYTIGLDTLQLSTSGLHREAEAQSFSGTPPFYDEEKVDGIVSGAHLLIVDSTASGQSVSMNFYNDRLEDTNFSWSGATSSNTIVGVLDTSYTPSDFTLKLEGNTTNWFAKLQSRHYDQGNESGIGGTNCFDSSHFKGKIVRVVLRGQDLALHNYTTSPFDPTMSAGCQVGFRCSVSSNSTEKLTIKAAYIDTAVVSSSHPYITPHTVGDPEQIEFSGSSSCTIPNGSYLLSDPIDFPISLENSYAVTFRIENGSDCFPHLWKDNSTPSNTYAIAFTTANATFLKDKNWINPGITNLPYIVAVENLFSTYAEGGVYTSPPVDTLMEKPEFASIEWTADTPSGTLIEIKARSGSNPEMTDAKDWSVVNAIPSPGSLTSINHTRYLQYQVMMKSSEKGVDTPKLRDISFQWPGETRAVNIGGILLNGPKYGQFEATIDGQKLPSPLRISLKLQQSVRGFNNTSEIITSESSFELNPRNNGR